MSVSGCVWVCLCLCVFVVLDWRHHNLGKMRPLWNCAVTGACLSNLQWPQKFVLLCVLFKVVWRNNIPYTRRVALFLSGRVINIIIDAKQDTGCAHNHIGPRSQRLLQWIMDEVLAYPYRLTLKHNTQADTGASSLHGVISDRYLGTPLFEAKS